ncbi:unnamed protein product [Chrysodeixis includens]|uniref:JAB1/MPN/MOV34 metalloenzyme domain-containing protein n=1 Tax=Chrysodeixis includens TaxID=689277 RepID=A0A9N8KQJ7_CHRIL|nr:unnamed protein product [Chrysodeixis includens]
MPSQVLTTKLWFIPCPTGVVDHFNRMGKIGNQKRVVGVLLGCWRAKGVLDVSNSFAVPFDEDDKDKSVWFLDHDYLENMYGMFKKVNAREIVGWYHTVQLHQNDVAINELISEIGAEEAEEVGVEHLLRDIKDTTVGSLSQHYNQLLGLKGLHSADIPSSSCQINYCLTQLDQQQDQNRDAEEGKKEDKDKKEKEKKEGKDGKEEDKKETTRQKETRKKKDEKKK